MKCDLNYGDSDYGPDRLELTGRVLHIIPLLGRAHDTVVTEIADGFENDCWCEPYRSDARFVSFDVLIHGAEKA